MSHKIIIFLLLILFSVNVFAVNIEDFPENETQSSNAEIAKMKGELIVKIQAESKLIKEQITSQAVTTKEELKDYIDEKTNPLYLNLPTILLLFIIVLIWGILKGRGKI